MTTGWLLLQLLIVSSQSVDSQSTTDDETCREAGLLSEKKKDTERILNNQLQLCHQHHMLLDNERQIRQQNQTLADIQQQLVRQQQTLPDNERQILQQLLVLHQQLTEQLHKVQCHALAIKHLVLKESRLRIKDVTLPIEI